MTLSSVDITLKTLLEQSRALHRHLCPRQVLGVRIGMHAGTILGIALPQTDKRVLAFVETDGSFSSGVSVASGCWLGRRTMRLMDYGKIAATFVDTKTEKAVRIIPQTDLRQRVYDSQPIGTKRREAYLDAYQQMPTEELLTAQEVQLNLDLSALISFAGKRVICQQCSEEVINEREILHAGQILCVSCVHKSYWQHKTQTTCL